MLLSNPFTNHMIVTYEKYSNPSTVGPVPDLFPGL